VASRLCEPLGGAMGGNHQNLANKKIYINLTNQSYDFI
jgi:hypothetical protein